MARWVLVVAIVIAGIYGLLRDDPDAGRHVFAGLPEATGDRRTWTRVLAYPGFAVGYSEVRGAPLWVAYRSGHVTDSAGPPRPDGFTRDWRAFHQPSPDALSGSGFTRGHLAPNYAISRLHGRAAQLASFHMTNIVAQRGELNAGVWQRIEELETDVWAAAVDQLWVITGPVFDAQRQWTDSGVEIPDAFYRVLIAKSAVNPGAGSADGLRTLTFLVPQDARANAPLTDFVASIDTVESAIGFDLLTELADSVELPLEARVTPHPAWRLPAVANRPGRYAGSD